MRAARAIDVGGFLVLRSFTTKQPDVALESPQGRRCPCRFPAACRAGRICRAGGARPARLRLSKAGLPGSEATRRSIRRSPTWTVARPSCGSRFSAMFILPMTLMRLTTSSWSGLGTSKASNTPAVDAEANDEPAFVGLDVHVRSAALDGLQADNVATPSGCQAPDEPSQRQLAPGRFSPLDMARGIIYTYVSYPARSLKI